MTTPSRFKTQAAEIAQLCGYISCDRSIANYFGIPTEQVTAVRSRMRRPAMLKPPVHVGKDSRIQPPTSPVRRDPCPRCQVRRDVGCRHVRALGHLWRFRQLVREHGEVEARRILRAEISDARRNRSFEDSLRLVARGQAKVVAVRRIVTAGPDYTLGGVATGAL